jgi:histidine ammonia-lyase
MSMVRHGVSLARDLGVGGDTIMFDGTNLTLSDVVRVADGQVAVGLSSAGLDRMRHSWLAAREAAARQPVYGRTTGVGANRTETVHAQNGTTDTHGMRLLRSHASGIGDVLPEREVRAMLAVRVNQLLRGGAGVRPAIAESIAAALNSGVYPRVHEYGAVGTGDLGPLAELGLALVGEGRWHGGGVPPDPVAIDDGDALALISSNALTIGQAALAQAAIGGLLRATVQIAALTLIAVDGSTEPFAAEVHRERPYDGACRVAAEMMRALGGRSTRGSRIQDPFGLRCLPQVHGAALDAATEIESVLAVELNAAPENPLIVPATTESDTALTRHHGGFHAAQLALALDRLRLALLSTAQLSAGRLSMLTEPEITGLRPFLASGSPASSGIMMLEYGVGAAIADLRAAAFPSTLSHLVMSRGVEEHASFASQAARQSLRSITPFTLVLAGELVAAVRALRLRDVGPHPGQPVREVYERACAVLDPDSHDRSLSDDVARAAALVQETAGGDGPAGKGS